MNKAFLAPLCCSVEVGMQVEHGLLSLQHLQAAQEASQEAEATLSTRSLSDVQCNEVYHRITGLLVGGDLWSWTSG